MKARAVYGRVFPTNYLHRGLIRFALVLRIIADLFEAALCSRPVVCVCVPGQVLGLWNEMTFNLDICQVELDPTDLVEFAG